MMKALSDVIRGFLAGGQRRDDEGMPSYTFTARDLVGAVALHESGTGWQPSLACTIRVVYQRTNEEPDPRFLPLVHFARMMRIPDHELLEGISFHAGAYVLAPAESVEG